MIVGRMQKKQIKDGRIDLWGTTNRHGNLLVNYHKPI